MINATMTMYNIALGIMGVLLLCCLVRAIMGPRIADRIIAINMMGTLVVMIICILSFLMREGYLKPERKGVRQQGGVSRPMQFVSPDGVLLYVGKNNRQNDALTLRADEGGLTLLQSFPPRT